MNLSKERVSLIRVQIQVSYNCQHRSKSCQKLWNKCESYALSLQFHAVWKKPRFSNCWNPKDLVQNYTLELQLCSAWLSGRNWDVLVGVQIAGRGNHGAIQENFHILPQTIGNVIHKNC